MGDRLAPVAEWLARDGRLVRRPASFLEQLMQRIQAVGIPVWRAYIGLQLIHPQLQAMGFMWRRGEPVQEIARRYGIQFTPAYIGSPMQAAREQGKTVRHRLDEITDADHIVLHELKAEGGIDYLAMPMRIRRDGPVPVMTFATDSRPGFTDEDVADLARLVDLIGAIVEMHIEHSVAETVANTYLGHQVGNRVLNGMIRRGEGEEINAVLWFSDLRDFTGMNERMPAGEMLDLLNNYLQLVGDALAANGGEILKFIGDGVMAYFPAEDALFLPIVTGQAVAAARRLIGDVAAANEARAAAGREPVRFGVGLHVGPVTFGNVGTEDRLDFTVIGPAVNRASRLEGLTKALGVPVCASAEFNDACMVSLKSLGKHRLRGIPQPAEIFTLPD
ncbi:adenylate/guanylate cyclase domain-containing protein [Reyranella sp.]|uniref:adenylate/guanylate cyclase domain-containing protein n=1 Tax=Reyranella sp. TaxID=1929291 RepID=UPI003BAB4E03